MATSTSSTSLELRMTVVLFAVVTFVVTQSSASDAPVKPIEYSISEEKPRGMLVGNVKLDSDLRSRYNAGDLAQMRFHFRHVAGQIRDVRDVFSVNELSGEIRTARVIDRDRMCAGASSCDVTFEVIVRPLPFFQVIRVVVHVDDVNDHAPTFPQDRVTLNILETTPVGTLFLLPSADDADSGQFAVRRYQLQSAADDVEMDNGPFELHVIDQDDGSKDVRLRLSQSLDRETVDTYAIKVVAVDGGRPVPLSGTLLVDVIVGDANDHSPRFVEGADDNSTTSAYSVDVAEDVAPMTRLLQVHAVDSDQGSNGEVVYGWAEPTERAYGNVFGIEPASGQIFVRKALDYEQEQVYQLTVKAVDRGVGSLPVYAKLTIRLHDVNDNEPSIVVNALTGSDVAEVREHVDPIGTFVAHIAVTDVDSGANGEVECQLGNDDVTNFRLEPLRDVSEYKLITGTVFDREAKSRYEVSLICKDRGEPSLTSQRVIIVDVVDINDHSPQLANELIEVSVVENSPASTIITRINATDLDSGRNGALHYRLVPLDVSTSGTEVVGGLVIEPVTGVVSTDRAFDYEMVPRDFRFLVIVADRGVEPRTATATLHLVVVDVNDARPRFDRQRYECVVSENTTIGSSVCRIVATDDDVTPAFRRIHYSMTSEQSANGAAGGEVFFRLDPSTGVLRTVRKLDREVQSEYQFLLSATDIEQQHHSDDTNNIGRRRRTAVGKAASHTAAFAHLLVIVSDENDNRPVFLFPSSSSGSHVTVELRPSSRQGGSENGITGEVGVVVGGGTLVVRLVARDADEGRNAELTYSITHGNEDGIFLVDSATGVITVSATGPGLDTERQSYRLVVSAMDGGNPRLAAVADLDVRVDVSTPSELSSPEAGTQSFLDANTVILLAGLVLGLVLVVVAIAVAVVCVRRHGRRRREFYLAVKRDHDASAEAAVVISSEKCGIESEPSLGNRCSELDYPRSGCQSRCQCTYRDTECCSLRCHGNGCDGAVPGTMTTTYSSVRPHTAACCGGNHEQPNSATTCSDFDDELNCFDADEMHHQSCSQCFNVYGDRAVAMETSGCYSGETTSSTCQPCLHVTSPCPSIVAVRVAEAATMTSMQTPRCPSRNSAASSCTCSCQQQQLHQRCSSMHGNGAGGLRPPLMCGSGQRLKHHGHLHPGRRHHHRHSGSAATGSHRLHHHSTGRHRRALTSGGSSLGGGSSTCSRSSLSPSSGASSAAQSPVQSNQHLPDIGHAESLMTSQINEILPDMLTVLKCSRKARGDHLNVDKELPVSADSDPDAGNCSASDSGRGLSYEVVTDDMAMRNQSRLRGRSSGHHDNKLRAHAMALELTTIDLPQGDYQSLRDAGKQC